MKKLFKSNARAIHTYDRKRERRKEGEMERKKREHESH